MQPIEASGGPLDASDVRGETAVPLLEREAELQRMGSALDAVHRTRAGVTAC